MKYLVCKPKKKFEIKCFQTKITIVLADEKPEKSKSRRSSKYPMVF